MLKSDLGEGGADVGFFILMILEKENYHFSNRKFTVDDECILQITFYA